MKQPHGFENVSESIHEKEHIPMARARAILAAGARKAGAKAQKENPKLLKVAGVKKKY